MQILVIVALVQLKPFDAQISAENKLTGHEESNCYNKHSILQYPRSYIFNLQLILLIFLLRLSNDAPDAMTSTRLR